MQRIGARAWGFLSSTWTLGALVFLLTWGGGGEVMAGIDPSWQAGLNIALEQGIEHGDELLFSYGPLGFLKSYLPFYAWPARLALVYGIAAHLALSLSLVWAARRSFPLPVALALALVAAALIRGDAGGVLFKPDATLPVLAFIWCVAALGEQPSGLARRLVVYAGGPVAAIEVLAKLNTGIVVLALVAITVVAIEPDRRRNVATLAASFVASLLALWLSTGQGAAGVGEYLSGGLEIVSGYLSAMRAEAPGREVDAVVAPAIVAVAFGVAWASTRNLPRGRRAVILLLLALLVFSAFKAGFVRHTLFQVSVFYATLLGACLAFRLPSRSAAGYLGAVAVAGVAVAATLSTETSGFVTYPMSDPIENAGDGLSSLEWLVDPGELDEEIAAGRARMRAEYDLDPRTLALLEGEPAHVDPWEAGVAWAYGLEWRALPVFQSYLAYTGELDRRNAAALASDEGPERILRQRRRPFARYPGSIGDRYPGFDSPAAMIEMLCHFRALRTTGRWQVLGRVPDRCGEPEELSSVEASYGERVEVPVARGNRVVLARVHGVEVSGPERVVSFLYRPASREISFDAGRPYTLVPDTAADGLLLRAPPRVDFPRPFEIAPNARDVSFLRGGEASSDRLTIEFFAMRVSPRPVGSRGS